MEGSGKCPDPGRVPEGSGNGIGRVREGYRVRASTCRAQVTQDPVGFYF